MVRVDSCSSRAISATRCPYSWKTLSSWKGRCRTLILRFTDGQELRADFRFT